MPYFEVEPEADLAASGDITDYRRAHDADFDDDDVAGDGYIPNAVETFLRSFPESIKTGDIEAIQFGYDSTFPRLTDKFYKSTVWPEVADISSFCGNNKVFLCLYKELAFRHLYAVHTPTFQQRLESWNNYVDLFDIMCDEEVRPSLPLQWLWDIVDEFIYQFRSFCTFRAKLKTRTPEEIEGLKKNQEAWDVLGVLTRLDAVVFESRVNEQLDATRADPTATIDSTGPTGSLTMLGYFSLIGQLRVHCLLGDYHTGMELLSHLDFQRKAPLFTRIAACHITTFYYLGFSYMMLRRYADAIKTFVHILVYISRTKQYHSRSYQYDEINKKNEQMYALLAICITLCPSRIDEVVQRQIRDKHGDKLARLAKGDAGAITVYEELFSSACPRFVSASPPNYNEPASSTGHEAFKLQQNIFLREIKQQEQLPLIRSYLKLYTSINTAKLATFLGLDDNEARSKLMCLKHKTRCPVRHSGPPLDGNVVSTCDVTFALDNNVVHIADTKESFPYSDFFIRHISKFEEIITDLSE